MGCYTVYFWLYASFSDKHFASILRVELRRIRKVMSCTPDILKNESKLKHAVVKLQAIHTTIKYTTRYSQLGKTTGPKNQKTKVW
jgi:hypothetical protein